MLTLARHISREVIERKHTDVNLLLSACAAMGDEVLGAVGRLASLSFMESCEGPDLDAYIYNKTGITRKPASPGFTYVKFLITSPSTTSSFYIPPGTLVQTGGGLQYQTNEGIYYVEGNTETGLVEARSLFAGSEQQVLAGDIQRVVSVPQGAPSSIGCVNPFASAGASDKEQDPEFRSRARAYRASIGKGTKAAVEAAALAYPGVRKVVLLELADELGRSGKYNQLIVADRFTEGLVLSTGASPTYQQQADILARNVLASISNVRASGVPIDAIVASVQLLSFQVQAPYTAAYGVSEGIVRNRIRGTVAGYTNALAIGQSLDRDTLLAAIRNIPGVYGPGATILSPAGSVVASPVQALRTTPSLVGLT
jgi:uncharacterized phage protein gp47/JayE